MKNCDYCGTELAQTGAPIWEEYCPNKTCDREARNMRAFIKQLNNRPTAEKTIDIIQKQITILRTSADEMPEWVEDRINEMQRAINDYNNRNTINLDPFN